MNFATVVAQRETGRYSTREIEREGDRLQCGKCGGLLICTNVLTQTAQMQTSISVQRERSLSLSLYICLLLPLSLGTAAIYILTNPNCGDCCRCCFCLHAKHILGCNVRHIDRRIINTIINTMG